MKGEPPPSYQFVFVDDWVRINRRGDFLAKLVSHVVCAKERVAHRVEHAGATRRALAAPHHLSSSRKYLDWTYMHQERQEASLPAELWGFVQWYLASSIFGTEEQSLIQTWFIFGYVCTSKIEDSCAACQTSVSLFGKHLVPLPVAQEHRHLSRSQTTRTITEVYT